MKKIICIFLMLWLPLFMQGAWAMSTHMLLDEAGINTHAEHAITAENACHQDNHSQPSSHHCSHCIACAITTAFASYDNAPIISLQPNSSGVFGDTYFYVSPYLISLVKPPILS